MFQITSNQSLVFLHFTVHLFGFYIIAEHHKRESGPEAEEAFDVTNQSFDITNQSSFVKSRCIRTTKPTMTSHAVATNTASSSEVETVESRDVSAQKKDTEDINKTDATPRTAAPSVIVNDDSETYVSAPLSSKKAFFENIFKRKESTHHPSVVQTKPATKIWSPRREKMESSPCNSQVIGKAPSTAPYLPTSSVQKEGSHATGDNYNDSNLQAKSLGNPTSDVANHSDGNRQTTIKDVPTAAIESSSIERDILCVSSQALPVVVSEATINTVDEVKPTITGKRDDPSEQSYMKKEKEELMSEKEELSVSDIDKKVDDPEFESPVVHDPDMSRSSSPSGSKPVFLVEQSTFMISTPTSNSYTSKQQDIGVSHPSFFNELKQMWGEKAAKSKPLSPEKHMIVIEASGQQQQQKVYTGEPEEMELLIEVKSEGSSIDDIQEEKKQETDDVELLGVQNIPPSVPKEPSSSHVIHPSSDQKKTVDVDTNTLDSQEVSDSLQVFTSDQNGSMGSPRTYCKKEQESTESTTEETMHSQLEDTMIRTASGVDKVVEEGEVKDGERGTAAVDDESDEESVFAKLLDQSSPKDPAGAIKESAGSITKHAKRSFEKFQTMMNITEQYRVKETPKLPALTSPIGEQIKKFEAFSKGQKIDHMPLEVKDDLTTDVADHPSSAKSVPMEGQTEECNQPSSPKRFSFYQPSKETLNLLERLSEPVECDAFVEELPTPTAESVSRRRGFVAKTIETIESGEPLGVEDEVQDDDDEIVRVTREKAAAVREAAFKMSSKSSGSRSADEIERLPSKEVPAPDDRDHDADEDNPNISMLTDALSTAEMDTTFALDEDTYDQAMALVAGVASADRAPSPKYGNESIGLSRSQSNQYEAVDHAKCGDACVIM